MNECYAESAAATLDALYQLEYGKDADPFDPEKLAMCSGHGFGETGLPEDVLGKRVAWSPKHGCHPRENEATIKLSEPIVLCDLKGNNFIENHLEIMLRIAPVSVGIPSSNLIFRNYKAGVLEVAHFETASNTPDHAVSLIGFGAEEGVEYWTLRNSWGPAWGEDGYFRVQRKRDGSGVLGSYAATAQLLL